MTFALQEILPVLLLPATAEACYLVAMRIPQETDRT